MRLVFLGTPDVAVAPLEALVAAGHDVAVVVSQPDRKRGRGGALVPSPVKAAATRLGLATSDRVDDVIDAGADIGVVVAYGRLIRPHVLDALPFVNLHFSLLPRWRGAAPVERAILAGDEMTGACIMALEEGLDTGPVYACDEVAIGPEDTAYELRATLSERGTALLLRLLDQGLPEPRPQEGEPTYASKLEPAEHHLEWDRPAVELNRVVRLGQAWTTFRGTRFKVVRSRVVPHPRTGQTPAASDEHEPDQNGGEGGLAPGPGEIDAATLVVGTGDGGLELVEVQPEGRPVQAARSWRNGARLRAGDRLGAPA